MVDDGRTDAGRTPDHGHPISSPCEPNGSGELKTVYNEAIFLVKLPFFFIQVKMIQILDFDNWHPLKDRGID